MTQANVSHSNAAQNRRGNELLVADGLDRRPSDRPPSSLIVPAGWYVAVCFSGKELAE
jgi:hypothetical protein